MRHARDDVLAFPATGTRGRSSGGAAGGSGGCRLGHDPNPFELLRDFLLAGDRLGRALAGTRIGMRTLAVHREPAAMPKPAVAGEVHQSLDVHRHLAAQVALDRVVTVDGFADADDLVIGQRIDATRLIYPHFPQDLRGLRLADPVDILQPHHHTLGGGNVHAGYTSQNAFSFKHLWRADARTCDDPLAPEKRALIGIRPPESTDAPDAKPLPKQLVIDGK